MARPRRRQGLRPEIKIGIVVAIALGVGLGLGALIYRGLEGPAKKAPKPMALSPHQKAIPALIPPPLPKKPKGPAPGLPAATQFDFYTILPEIRDKKTRRGHNHLKSPQAVHEAHGSKPAIAHTNTAATQKTGDFILQAASFPDRMDASRLRAELGLRGLASYIEQVSISGRGAFYRVRLGPITKDQVAHDRRILTRLGMTPILLREARGN